MKDSEEFVTEYWLRHYVSPPPAGICTLCGNWGIIDTRTTAISPAGFIAGKLNYCICPNGQTMREGGADLEKTYMQSREKRRD